MQFAVRQLPYVTSLKSPETTDAPGQIPKGGRNLVPTPTLPLGLLAVDCQLANKQSPHRNIFKCHGLNNHVTCAGVGPPTAGVKIWQGNIRKCGLEAPGGTEGSPFMDVQWKHWKVIG